ncbi:type VI secretion protein [Chromobacterium piscinae]|nr:type VI secretion protein [Chromobacterium piscinae]
MNPQHEDQDDGELLVTAMTRPSMIGGMTLTSIGLSVYMPGMAAMLTRSLYPALLIPVFLLISYLICLKDVYLFSIFGAGTFLKTCRNFKFWRCRTYVPK